MRPLMRLVLGLAALAAILMAVSIGLPAHVTVARSVVINAPEFALFPYLNDLHNFKDWSPWKKRDPDLDIAYSGNEKGKGAAIAWTSQKKSVGTGSMEITESEPNRRIGMDVNLNGLEGTSAFELAPAGSGSKLTWNFGFETGSSPLKRWKGLMLDGLVGTEYRAALDTVKEKIETERRPTVPTASIPVPGMMVPGTPGMAPMPGAELVPGAAAVPGAAMAPGTTVPMTVPPAGVQQAVPGAAQPAAGTPQAAQPEPQEVEPAPAPAAKPKKRQRRRTGQR